MLAGGNSSEQIGKFKYGVSLVDRQKKIDKRRRKKAQQSEKTRQWDELQRRRDTFPKVIFENAGCNESLSSEVRQIMSELVEANALPPELRRKLKTIHLQGFPSEPLARSRLSIQLGKIIYEKIAKSFQKGDRIAFDVQVDVGLAHSRQITLSFKSLEKVSSRLFCSPKHHTIQIGDESLIVVFDVHTLEQIGTRTVVDPDEYTGRGQAFSIPYHAQYFESVDLPNGQPAIALWNWCNPQCFLGDLQQELLGPRATPRRHIDFPYFEINGQLGHYLVGYCPIRRFSELPNHVILRTLLLPGMDNTPEFAAYVRRHKLDTVGRANLSKRAAETTHAKLYITKSFNLIREFHELVPQVKPIEVPTFDYSFLNNP